MTITLQEQATNRRQDTISLAQELIRTPSLSGREEEAGRLVARTMGELGYDQVTTDRAGNVIGCLRGEAGPVVLLSSHLDCADPGDRSAWSKDPFGGELSEGFLHGCGASASKGALAAQLMAGHLLKSSGLLQRGTLVVAATVMGERGDSLGMQQLCDVTLPELQLEPHLVVVGDPTGLDIYLGHRGQAELEIISYGRTCEASAPWLGINAAYKMMPVIRAVKELDTILPAHPILERSTIALTDLRCQPGRPGTVPDRCLAGINRRFLPTESLDEILGQLQSILAKLSAADSDFSATVRVRSVTEQAYTGYEQVMPQVLMPFLIETGHPLVQQALHALQGLGEEPRTGKWYFASGGAYSAGVRKIPTIGYAPGEEKFGHTPFDRVSLDALERAVAGNAAIFSTICA